MGTSFLEFVFLSGASTMGELQTRAGSAPPDRDPTLRRPSPLLPRRRGEASAGGIIDGVEKGSLYPFCLGSANPEMGSK